MTSPTSPEGHTARPGRGRWPGGARPGWARWRDSARRWRARWRRAGRWRWAAIAAPLALVALLLAADRIAAAQAENAIAARLAQNGFDGRPDVTVEGFPFLTQLLAGHLDAVAVPSGRLRLGPVTASVRGRATGITLGQGGDATIARVSGTGLITYTAVDTLARASGVPGAGLSAAGPGLLRLRLSLPFLTVTATASVAANGPGALRIHLVSAPGVPSFLLQRIRTFTVHLPGLPLGLALRSVSVTRRGVVIAVGGRDIRFSG